MCGIVAAVSQRNVLPVLIDGLRRLEYRGYDSCGVALQDQGRMLRVRSTGRVHDLAEKVTDQQLHAYIAIAHTRWATHGAPEEANAHPHFSSDQVALVHNGIIENYAELRDALIQRGYVFDSQTDSEVIAHLIHSCYRDDLLQAVAEATAQLRGAYALAVFAADAPERIIGARLGSPLVLGVAEEGVYLASDAMALAGTAEMIAYLEDGDIIDIQQGRYLAYQRVDHALTEVERPTQRVQGHSLAAELGPYRHYMQKEIFEQPKAIADTLSGIEQISPEHFGQDAAEIFDNIDQILILACGTSSYSGLTAKYWLEAIAGVPTQVEIASEYRYRQSISNPRTLIVTISQSGETADTLAALRHAKKQGMTQTLTLCNVASSAMVRECRLAYITRAGVEIGVASTKAFTTQLVGLYLLTLTLAKRNGRLSAEQETAQLNALRHLPVAVQSVLALEPAIIAWSEEFTRHNNALFLGRGSHYPIALEGALKLKEISYIHAEAYPAGELKHGPLALVDEHMPVVTVAPNDALLEKLKSNIEEVRARRGALYVFADQDTSVTAGQGLNVITLPEHYGALSPILHVIPLQLLAYHTACARGTDIDKPRNLAKSVTVE